MSKKDTTFLNDVDFKKVDTLMQNTNTNVKYFNDTCAKVVNTYSEALDNLMSDLYVECIKNKNTTIDILEKYYLELSNMIYFMIEKLEQLSVYADMSKSMSKEVYSKSYLANQISNTEAAKTKITVAELTAKAEIESQYESIVATIYEHAYKVLKGKIESAKDMTNTLRKIITHKMNEEQFSMYSGGTRFTPTKKDEFED